MHYSKTLVTVFEVYYYEVKCGTSGNLDLLVGIDDGSWFSEDNECL